MSRAGKPKGKKGKGLPADREVETRFIEDGADTGQKTGHGKSPGASAVSRGGDGPVETSSNADHEASGEGDPLKKRKKSFTKRVMSLAGRSSSSSPKPTSKKNVQSPTSSLAAVGDAGRQSETIEPLGAGASVQKPSTVSSCDSQASGGPLSPTAVSPTAEQMHSHEERIRELEQKLLNSDTSSRLEGEVQRRETEHRRASADLEEKHASALQEKIKLEEERLLQQHKAELGNQEKALRAVFRKQLREKEEEISARDSETKKLQEELTQKEKRFNEERQHVHNTQIKVTQTQESQLQNLRQELAEKGEEMRMKLREKETQVQRFVQKAEKRLQDSQTQLQQEQERHAQEKKQMTENYETQLQKAAQQLEAEKERLLGENQQLQQEQIRSLEEMADKRRQYEEQQQKDIPQQSAQEADQVTKGHEAQMEQLKLQHKRALEEKDRQLTESRSQFQEMYDKDMMKGTREFQVKLADAERRHKTQLEDKQKQYESSLSDLRKRQDDALELQVAQVRRSHEKESQSKEEETTLKVEQQIQQREQVLRQELQQREQMLLQELHQMEQEAVKRETQLRKKQDELLEQEMVHNQFKIQLEETLRQQKSKLEAKVNQLEEDMWVKGTELEAVLRELEDLKEENGELELRLRQRELSLMKSQGASEEALLLKREECDVKMAEQVKALQEKLQARDEELELLQQQATGNGVPLQASLKYDDLPPGTDPRVEIATLKRALESKEQKVESLQVQVRSFEGVIKHIKEQSKQVLKLKRELSAIIKEKEAMRGEEIPIDETKEDRSGTDQVPQLEQLLAVAEGEKLRMEQERDSYKMEVEHLRGDLEVTENEIAKEEKKQKEGKVALRLQLEVQKSINDQLHHQLEQTEAAVRQLTTDLNFSKAEVAELEGGIAVIKLALSDAELDRQGLLQELSKVKQQRDTLDQKYLSLLALYENLKSKPSRVLDDVIQVKHEASLFKETLATQGAELSKLRREVGALRRENDDLRGEIEARKAHAALWEEDFQRERHDREQAAGRIDDERAEMHMKCSQLREELQKCSTTIHQFQSENKRLQDEIEVYQKLNDDVLAKTQQVKQYKKQVDGLKAAREELSHLVAEKDALLQAAEAEQLRLRQLTQEKDRFLDQLRQRVSTLTGQIQRYPQQPQSQHSHRTDFWEVPRNEITLNMHKMLGTGAWGFVVEGIFRGQKVAVKCLHDMIRHPEAVATIRKEIGIMAQIRHPNLVLLIAAVIDTENDPLIVTELLDVSLRKAYEDHRLQGSSKLSIFRDVASALNYLHLHRRGEIIHRDVSSANVLLEAKPNNQWKAKLSDFGSAKLAMEAKTTGPGAPAYTAPEVRKDMGIRQTGKLDVYSYGVLLCEVIVEQFPMDGSFPGMVQTVQSRWPFMHGLVTHCTQDHPDNRPTMSHVLGEFDKLRPNE